MTTKLRPSLTLDEIQIIIASIHEATNTPCATARTVLAKLNKYAIQAGDISISHHSVAPLRAIAGTRAAPKQTKEQRWEAAYTKSIQTPHLCSPAELQDADEWRYINDLMTREEVIAFESMI